MVAAELPAKTSLQLTKLAEQSNFKAVLAESTKLLNVYPNDLSLLIFRALGHALSSNGKYEASVILEKCLKIDDSKLTSKEYQVMTTSQFTNAIVASNIAGCNQILAKTIIQYLKDVPEKLDFDFSLYIALIDNLVWSLEFTLVKQMLILLKKHYAGNYIPSELIEMRLVMIIYIELFHFDSQKEKQKHSMCAKILENKVRSFIKAKNAENDTYNVTNTDVQYVLASLCFENGKYDDGLALVDAVEQINNDSEKKSLVLQNHNVYGFTLAYRGRNFEKALYYIKMSLKNENFDASLLDLIFGLKESDANDAHLIVTNEFIDQVRQVIDNINCASDEAQQYKLLFKFSVLLRNYETNESQKMQNLQELVDFLGEYFSAFSTKPFCIVDLRSFASKIINFDRENGIEMLKGLVQSEILSASLHDYDHFENNEQKWLANATKYMTVQWFKFFIGEIMDVAETLQLMQEWRSEFKKASEIVKNDSEKMYSFCQLLLLSATILDHHSKKLNSISLAFAALALLTNLTENTQNDSFFMFKIKQQLIANRIGLPDFLSCMDSLELNDTQYDSLLYMFLPRFSGMNVCSNFSGFIHHIMARFDEICRQVNQMYTNMNSFEITLLYEDYAEFTIKTIKSQNKYLLELMYEVFEGMKNMNFANLSLLLGRKSKSDVEDINDYSICEFFNPLTEQDFKSSAENQYDELFREIDAIKSGYQAYKLFFDSLYQPQPACDKSIRNLLCDEIDVDLNAYSTIDKIMPFCSRLMTLLMLHNSANSSKIAPKELNGKTRKNMPHQKSTDKLNYHALIHKINDHFSTKWKESIDNFESEFKNQLSGYDIAELTNTAKKHISSLSRNILKNKNRF